MRTPVPGSAQLVAGPPDLASLHERSLPQKDQLCGPFWGALALTASGHPARQDDVALRAGTILAEGDPATWLPPGASPRTDYATRIPPASEGAPSGTSASALARSIEELSGGALAVVPVANLRTGRLWGSRPPARLLLDFLLGLKLQAPPPDWDCGHFLALVASVRGPGGTLLALRDTYPELGWGGYHLQPAEAVAASLERGDGHEGGVLCVCEASTSAALAARLPEAGFELRHWDNGSPDLDPERRDARR